MTLNALYKFKFANKKSAKIIVSRVELRFKAPSIWGLIDHFGDKSLHAMIALVPVLTTKN